MSDVIAPVVPTVPAVAPAVAPVDQTLPPGVPPVAAPVRNDGVPQPTPAAPVPAVDADDPFTLATGNPALDTAINTFVSVTGAKTADLERAVANALEYDNPALIDRVFLKEKFGKYGDQAIALAEAAVNEQTAQITNRFNQAQHTVNTAAGGAEQWQQAVSVFNSTGSPEIKAAVKALMDQGNIADGAKLLLQNVSGSGLLPEVNPSLQGGSTTGAGAGALSSAQFQSALAELRKEAGNRSFETGPLADKYNQLITRRSAGKKLGL